MRKDGLKNLYVSYQGKRVSLSPNAETEYGEPQIWLDLSDGSSLEITQERVPKRKELYSMRHHCSDEAFDNGNYPESNGVIAEAVCSEKKTLAATLGAYLDRLAMSGVCLDVPGHKATDCKDNEVLHISCQHLSGDTKRFLDRISKSPREVPTCLKTSDGWTLSLSECSRVPYFPDDLGLCLLLAIQHGYGAISFSDQTEPFLSLPVF